MVKKITKETKEETVEVKVEAKTETKSDFENLLEIYQKQNPAKYALKEAELKRKLEANK